VKRKDHRIIEERKRNLEWRLDRGNLGGDPERPVFGDENLHCEMSDRMHATGCGGIGAMRRMVEGLGLDRAINENLRLLKIRLPYHESDYVLNMAYNVLAGGTRLEDIEDLRQDAAYMDAPGAVRDVLLRLRRLSEPDPARGQLAGGGLGAAGAPAALHGQDARARQARERQGAHRARTLLQEHSASVRTRGGVSLSTDALRESLPHGGRAHGPPSGLSRSGLQRPSRGFRKIGPLRRRVRL